jgi:hypothetical protein
MSIIYSKPQAGNFPAAVIVGASEDGNGGSIALRAESSMNTAVVKMTRQELLDMADAIQLAFA